MMENTLERLSEKAREGDSQALTQLVKSIQDRIYGLSIRMLYYPADAEDATQEILIKIITHLNKFRGESRFITWAYRIAANHLLTTRKRRAERWELSFDEYERAIDEGLAFAGERSYDGPEEKVLVEEAKLACMQGMLMCMKRETRLAYIVGEIFEFSGMEGSRILGVTPETFRQRLSRARRKLKDFLAKKCSVFDPQNPCHCERQVACDVEKRRLINPHNLLFVTHPCRARENNEAAQGLAEIREMLRVAMIFRSQPDYAAPEGFAGVMRKMVRSGQINILTN